MTKQSHPADIWAWIREDQERLVDKGGQHQAIIDNYNEFWRSYNDDLISADLAIAQALEAALATGELKWQLHLRHWRLQLWLKHNQVKRALPEAVDLLSLSTDRRVQDVPQRICAYHDIVECYVKMDPHGYHDEIVENAHEILGQLPKKHSCATCARSNLATTAAAVGNVEEAERWVNQTKATMTDEIHPSLAAGFGRTAFLCGKLDEAESTYLNARNLAVKRQNRDDFIDATVQLGRIYLEKDNLPKAFEMLDNAQQHMKYMGGSGYLAPLAALEGRLAVAVQKPQQALNFLQRAAQIYLDLGLYRAAAEEALYAADVARAAQSDLMEASLDIAAQAVGFLPPASTDLYQKLASFERQPVDPATLPHKDEMTSAEAIDKQELRLLQDMLHEHIKQHQLTDVCVTLYRLARWHNKHGETRAAVDYLINEAMLERILKLPNDDREDAIGSLRRLREGLPDKTVEIALTAAESGPPSWLLPIFPALPLTRWLWNLRAIEADLSNRPFVEPEPESSDKDHNFQSWLDHIASMAALILRFPQQCDAAELALWVESLNSYITDAESRTADDPEGREQLAPVVSFLQGMIAFVQGVAYEDIKISVLSPFAGVFPQIAEIAQRPVWFHPEASPLDFLVEQAAQKAVQALRQQDDWRSRRLKNLAFRYKLMAIDLRAQEPLVPLARFLDALRELVLLEGKQMPVLEAPLDEPFDSVLAGIYTAGQESATLSEQAQE